MHSCSLSKSAVFTEKVNVNVKNAARDGFLPLFTKIGNIQNDQIGRSVLWRTAAGGFPCGVLGGNAFAELMGVSGMEWQGKGWGGVGVCNCLKKHFFMFFNASGDAQMYR